MNSIESALFLRDLFDRVYHSGTTTTIENSMLVSDLYRETEALDDFTCYTQLLNEFADYDLYKMFGLTLNDFLNLNTYEKETIIAVAKERNDKIIAMQKKIKEDMENLSGNKGRE